MGLILGRKSYARRDFGFTMHARPQYGDLITYSGDGHLTTFAPTGTGKTSSSVITNALTHPGQLIVLDIKGEVYAATAQARLSMGQDVYTLDMRDGAATGSLNPLDLAKHCGTDIAAVARSFAAELIERPPDERDPFWSTWAETLITGGIAWMMADLPADDRRISKLFDLFHGEDVVYSLSCMLDTLKTMNRCTKTAFSAFLQLPDHETRPSVLGTTQTHLRLFDSDLVRRLTDESTIDIEELIAGEPLSLYIIVPAYRLTAFRPLLRMWLSSIILAFTQRTTPPKERTLMLVDEAGNLGKIDALLTAATLLRSSGLTLWTFFQNGSQLSIYGPQANTLVDNAGVVQVFGARNYRMAQDIANLIGGVSPDEILRMPPDEQILLIEGRPVRCRQVRYYSDSAFISKA